MRVMTLNLWNYNQPWNIRRELLAGLITDHAPDVVALQESRHDWRYERGRGQGEQLAERTGYHPTSAIAQVYIPLLRVDEGLTILTREPPAEVEVLHLTLDPKDREDENHRICLMARLRHNSGEVAIFDTHFSLSPAARRTNARETARFVEDRAPDSPAVLMGDLNALPDAPEIRFLRGEVELDGQTTRFLDCWMAAHPGQPGYTYASYDPVKRIDYVLARHLPPGPIGAAVVGAEGRDGVYPSDHLGIVVDLPI